MIEGYGSGSVYLTYGSGSATLLTSDFLVSKSDLDGEFLLAMVLLDEELALLQQTQLHKQTLSVSCQPRKVLFYYPAKDLLGQENTQLTD